MIRKTSEWVTLLVAGATVGLAVAEENGQRAAGVNAFGLALYQQLADGENAFYSPLSVVSALHLARLGAAGDTAAEMETVLHAKQGARSAVARLLRAVRSDGVDDQTTLNVANGLWVQQGVALRPDFVTRAREGFGAAVEDVDFEQAADAAAAAINDWVSTATREKIRQLVSMEDVRGATLVLVNAVYFKAAWAQPFESRLTEDGPFHLAEGAAVKVPLMRRLGRTLYGENDAAQVIALPYAGRQVEMIVVLPRGGVELGELTESLTAERVAVWRERLGPEQTLVVLPRFEVETRYLLNAPLRELGLRRAFSRADADFSGITAERELFIDLIVHKAYVNVDEAGTEAAAATAIAMKATSAMPGEPKRFVADRPFLFVLRERETGVLLFVGSVYDPRG